MINEGMLIGDRYEVLGLIGSGGMADVYKARDSKLNRLVAVKVLRQEFRMDKTFVAKFQKEAQAAAGLSHPNIVSVYDVGEDDNANFIVMELVEGITLKDYIKRKKKLSVREATSIAIQVSLGLEAAHKCGLVHRDVKPQNIMISTDGKVKLSDFGIARAASSNTISSNVMGSVHYSSPEQVRGGFANAQSDIYSLGITLYEMVTGRVPFDGDTSVSIAIKHLQEEIVPPNKYVPDLPYSLNQIILKCTQKSVDRRYASMADLIMDLKRSLVDPNGNFVELAPLSSHAQTIMLSKAEMDAIQAAAGSRYEEEEDDEDDEDEEDERPRRRRPSRYEEDDDDDDDEEGGLSGALEKIMTIGGFIIGAIIIVLLVVFIGRAAGVFGKDKTPDKSSSVVSSVVSNTSSSTGVTADGQVEVPDIKGKTVSEAQQMLNKVQLGIAKGGEEASDTVKEGLIIRQDLEAGTTVAAHSTVYYVVSTGVADINIPDVTGKSQTVAETTLKSSGLETEIKQENSDTVEIGNVIRTEPAAGTAVSSGSTVTVVVSLGKEDTQVEVPNVIGVSENTAKKTLSNLNLSVVVDTGTSTKVKAGEVMAQSIKAGTKVDQKTEITITVNSGTDEVTDPDTVTDPEVTDNTTTSKTDTTTTDNDDDDQEEAKVWACNQRLDTPPNYSGGAVKLTLSQVVNGKTTEKTVIENESPTFPLTFSTEGAEGVSVGTVYVYEKVNGEYKKIAKYTVPFEEY